MSMNSKSYYCKNSRLMHGYLDLYITGGVFFVNLGKVVSVAAFRLLDKSIIDVSVSRVAGCIFCASVCKTFT